jgi:hypothetical protein
VFVTAVIRLDDKQEHGLKGWSLCKHSVFSSPSHSFCFAMSISPASSQLEDSLSSSPALTLPVSTQPQRPVSPEVDDATCLQLELEEMMCSSPLPQEIHSPASTMTHSGSDDGTDNHP